VDNSVTCPNCQASQPAEAVFCDNCGQRLSPAPAQPEAQPTASEAPEPAAVAQVAAPPRFLRPGPDPAVGRVACPNCQSPNLAGASFCDQCGVNLPAGLPVSPAPADAPVRSAASLPDITGRDLPDVPTHRRQPAAPAPSSTFIEGAPGLARPVGRLVILATGAVLMLPSGKSSILVGREDPVSSIFPEVDLAPHGGEAGGVSRRHARFVVQGGTVFVEDLESTNFTFVNRQRVMPGVRQVVRHGDEVRFGRVAARYEGP
jgi:hypothetical protein